MAAFENAKRKKTAKATPDTKAAKKEPRWWVLYIAAPVIVGIILFLFQECSKPKSGELHLMSNVDSAKVFLNSAFRGYTIADSILVLPKMKPGSYALKVEKAPYPAFVAEDIRIQNGEITTRRAIFEVAASPDTVKKTPAPADTAKKPEPAERKTYSLTITVPKDFKNALITIDGNPVANAPNTIHLAKGRYRLRVAKGDSFYKTIINIPQRKLVNVTEKEFEER